MTESKLEGFLPRERGGAVKIDGKPEGNSIDLKTSLEKELEAEDSALGTELQRSRAEEIIARRRVSIDRLKAEKTSPDSGGDRGRGDSKDWLVETVAKWLDKGLDPATVGRLIDNMLGNGPSPVISLSGAAPLAGGMSFGDMKELFHMGQEANKTDPALAAILDKLSQRLVAIEGRVANTAAPVRTNYVLVKADGSIQEIEAGKPIILEPKQVDGQPIEVVKEQNRHAEEMEKIKTEKTFKEVLGRAVEDIPTNLGKGIAAEASRAKPGTKKASVEKTQEGGVTSFECQKCHATIFIPPDAPSSIKCLKCGTIYESDEKEPPADLAQGQPKVEPKLPPED